MKKVLVIAHKDLVPPDNVQHKDVESDSDRFKCPWITEYDVIAALKESGYEVDVLGIDDEISPLIGAIKEKRPALVFNMLEQFNNDPAMDYHIVTLLELHQLVYTGCNPKGLLLARDKALAKKILSYHKVATPKFFTLSSKESLKLPKKMKFPMIVKCSKEEASYGIAQASVVKTPDKLAERVSYIQKELEQDVIVEEFIEGREIYVGVIGNKKLKTLPPWELRYSKVENPEKEIYTERAKWNLKYRERKGIENSKALLEPKLEKEIQKICKKTYRALDLSGYARIDLRIDAQDRIYVLEANPNPNIARDDEFAESAKFAGLDYTKLIDLIIKASQRPPKEN